MALTQTAPWQVILTHQHPADLPICLEMHRAALLFLRWEVFLGYVSEWPQLCDMVRAARDGSTMADSPR